MSSSIFISLPLIITLLLLGRIESKVDEPPTVITPRLLSLQFEFESDKKRVEVKPGGYINIVEELELILWLFGDFPKGTELKYSKSEYSCDKEADRGSDVYELTMVGDEINSIHHAAFTALTLPSVAEYPEVYFCLRLPPNLNWNPQGNAPWVHIVLHKRLLPLYLHVILIVSLLALSGLFSGLNLGLMSLNKTDLKIITNTGTPSERHYAATIAPVRNHGNFLLCCLLFSNVLVNATLTILVDELTSGPIAIAMSTLAIVIFGEIIPQAICSRHGLAVGAKTIYITKFFMALTFPLAYPLSKVLDKCLGEEIGSVYTRERLKELLRVTKDHHGLETEEVGIISGALDMKTKTVRDVMTSLDQVFMISIDSYLNFDTLAEIDFQGYSRIPVYDGQRGNVCAVLNVKQLTLLDGSDSIPIRTVVEYYKNSLFFVFENTRLDYMFRAFREGNRGHMAFVQKVNDDGPGDPYYETVGVVTMEDVLEELLQAEIMDETDVGKYQARLTHKERPRAVPFSSNKKYKQTVEIQPQLALAATQYLATNVEAFDRELVSESIVQRLLTTSVCYEKPDKSHGEKIEEKYLYRKSTDSDSFILILEGRVHVAIGAEEIAFEAGPFHHFGGRYLLQEFAKVAPGGATMSPTQPAPITTHSFSPDYSVRIISEVYFMKLTFSGYLAARQATEMERRWRDQGRGSPDGGGVHRDWEEEIEKVLNSDAGPDHNPRHQRIHMTAPAPSLTPTNSTASAQNRRRKSEPMQSLASTTGTGTGSSEESKQLLLNSKR